MPTFTVQRIIDRAAALADVTDNFVSLDMWLDWLNVEIQALDLFRARSGWTDAVIQPETINSAPYEFEFAVSPEIVSVVGVWEVQPNAQARYRRLKRIDQAAGLAMQEETGTAHYYSIWTLGNGHTIQLHPTPTAGTYTTYVMPASSTITLVTDTLFYTQGMEERLVLGLAHRAKTRQEADASGIEKLIGKWETHVSELVWAKSFAETPTVRNVDFEERGWASTLDLPPFASWYML